MYALKFLLIAPFISLAQSQSAGAQQIPQSITNIDTAVQALNVALNAYNGGINESLPVFAASLNVHQVNRQGYEADMAVVGPLSDADSQQVDKRVNDTVAVSIPESVKLLEAKKPLFDAANVSSIIESTILLLKYDHETFSGVVAEKLTLAGLPGGLGGAGKIEAVLIEAAVYYAL